ncbi:hypothetical protein BGZ63DRAFT_386539 [Mariannaea sp. PMI_226]|nr:hypothetical protein BGZ63DRAFT_386539 [Mariannaea sp. PMI_226]
MPFSLPALASRWRRPPIHSFSLHFLVIVPILLAIATVVMLFVQGDVNAAMLWSQCHSRALLPGVSRIPAIGTPLCYLISFFHVALDSLRSMAIMAVILAFVGGLLTVSTVEAARICNAPNVLIAYPTGPWLVFNLIGGAVVWQLAIIPAFFHSAQRLHADKKRRRLESANAQDAVTAGDAQAEAEDHGRHLPDTEVIAIPVSVALGYFLPSILMLALNTPVTIGIWLFFPVYVSLVRQLVRKAVVFVKKTEPALIHLESSQCSLIIVYALPVILSVVSHIFLIWNLTQSDDRKTVTKSSLAFIEIDIQFIAWTVLYWMLVEVGWRVPLATFASSLIIGPGAGTCLGWVYREKLIHESHGDDDDEHADEHRHADEPVQSADEDTPLLA